MRLLLPNFCSHQVKIVEKLVPVETPSYACRGDLPATLKEDFDRILDEFKTNLKEQYENDRVSYITVFHSPC